MNPKTDSISKTIWIQRLTPYFWAALATAFAVTLRAALTPTIGTELPFITLFPAVFLSACIGGLGPTVLTTVLGILAALFWFIEPVHSLSLADPIARLGVALFGTSGIAMGWLGEARLRAHRSSTEAVNVAERETARAEQEAIRAEEEAARAEEESARAEEETLHAEEQAARAEQEAHRAAQASERVERILASITDAFTVMDHNWTITYMNERPRQWLGGSPKTTSAATIGRPFPPHWGVLSSMRTAELSRENTPPRSSRTTLPGTSGSR